MSKVYLMRRFDMNREFPKEGPRDIEPYIDTCFVLYHEDGTFIPLARGFGHTGSINANIAQGLRNYQERGNEVMGSVHPFFTRPIDIEGDIEYYEPFPTDSTDYKILKEHGVNLKYDVAA